MFELLPQIDKEFILDRVSQEEIFEKYLRINIVPGELFKSPLRDDNNPTCSIKKYSSGIVWFKDWSGHFSGDCFSLVQFMYNCTFHEACKIIASDFNLIQNIQKNKKRRPKKLIAKTSRKTKIRIIWEEYSYLDLSYWGLFDIPLSVLKYYNVAPVKFLWVDDKLVYSYSVKDPAYGYWFSNDEIKVYFPYRDSYRFLGNASCLQGYRQLPTKGKLLVITKSLKDVMFFYVMGISAVAPQTENTILSQSQYDELSTRFDEIIVIYDFDLAGVKGANKMKKAYGIVPKFFTNGRFNTPIIKGKDVTDISRNIGKQLAIETADKLIQSPTWFCQF